MLERERGGQSVRDLTTFKYLLSRVPLLFESTNENELSESVDDDVVDDEEFNSDVVKLLCF